MQHITQAIPSSYSQSSGGGRISSTKLRQSLDQADAFSGLDESVSRYDLLLLVKRAGKFVGFTPKMIQLLDYYMAFTREYDWEEGSRPIVYQSLSRTALDLGVSERQIQRLEQALFDAGALTWQDSGNHRRYGQRCDETGRILYAFGVDLSPLAALKEILQAKLHDKQLYDQAWMETKRQISWYRRQIRSILLEVEEGAYLSQAEIASFDKDYNQIAMQIRTAMDLSVLRELLTQHQELRQAILSTLESIQVVEQGSEADITVEDTQGQDNGPKTAQLTSKESCISDGHVTHNKYTTQLKSNKLDYSRHTPIILQEDVADRSAHNEPGSSRDERSKPQTRVGGLEQLQTKLKEIGALPSSDTGRSEIQPAGSSAQSAEAPGAGDRDEEEGDVISQTGLQHVSLKQLLNIASDRFKDCLPMEPRPMNHHDFVEAAYRLKSSLYISQKSWAEACTTLERIGAALCVILTDQATLRDTDPVTKPSAYFNAMINRAHSGELRLHQSVMGHLKREVGCEAAKTNIK